MKTIRTGIFETNSSSTHALVCGKEMENGYTPFGDTLKIRFINTDDEVYLDTLSDKVSYLVSHIASWYKYDAPDYETLIEQVKCNYEFKELENYVFEKYGKKIVFPVKYDGEIEDIVEINHQLTSWNRTLDDVMDDILSGKINKFDTILANGNCIEFGRD